MNFEHKVMKTLLQKARQALGKTSPNPVTAAAIIKNNKVISFGVHQKAGGPHAEVLAIEKAGSKAKGATLLVNLEPCTHHGKTPPCVEAIIDANISRVVYAMGDPNPKVSKNPAKKLLKAAGIDVETGLLESQALAINEHFCTHIQYSRPFVTLKVAMSLDGKIALPDGQSGMITSEPSLKKVHKMRREYDGILVGINTVLIDKPQLDVRYGLLTKGFKNPSKIIIDPHFKLDPDQPLLKDKTPVFLVVKKENKSKLAKLPTHVRLILDCYTDDKLNWKKLLKAVYKAGIYSLFVEGGEMVYTSAIEAKVVDKVYTFIAPKFLGGKKSLTPFAGVGVKNTKAALPLKNVSHQKIGDDLLITGYLK